MLDKTLGYILCCQSPALFLAALALLVAYLAGRKHRVKAFFRLLLCILCAVGAVALYFLGIYKEYFTIRDFFVIRAAGWIGLAIAAFFVLLALVRAFFAAADARRAQKEANRAENERLAQEAEAARAAEEPAPAPADIPAAAAPVPEPPAEAPAPEAQTEQPEPEKSVYNNTYYGKRKPPARAAQTVKKPARLQVSEGRIPSIGKGKHA